MQKPLTMWITTNCGKFLKRWEYQTTLPISRNLYAGQETTVQIEHGKMDWFKTGKGSTSTIVEIWEKFDRGCSRFYFSKDGCSNVSCPHGLLEPYLSLIKRWRQDFSGGPVVKNLPSKAGDTGSIPGLGRFHMLRGNCWARLLMLCNEKLPQWDILAPQLEKACEQQGRPSTVKEKKKEVEADSPSLESFGLEALTNTFWGTWPCLIPWLDHKRPCSFSLTAGTLLLRATMTDVWIPELPCCEEDRAHGEA